MKARLILEDGSIFEGQAFGAIKQTEGEVVFNTGMTGYQEILTDPSYAGQIVAMTYPLIGNYGFNREDLESTKSHVRGFVVKEVCRTPSNWRSLGDLESYLKENGITGIEGIDTRALTRRLRDKGTMKGIISLTDEDPYKLLEKVKNLPGLNGVNMVKEVTTSEKYFWGGNGCKVAVIDFGVKHNILRSLVETGCEVTVYPAWVDAEEIITTGYDGVLLSNGPGDPKAVTNAAETVKKLLGRLPIFGICLGHQILALALGADTYKMKFGHRGVNHPVKDLQTGRVYITSQNHGFAVDENSIDSRIIEVTHRNLNDGTIEGIRHKKLPAFSIQYHPEASPGPTDSKYLFEKFLSLMKG